MNIDARCKTCNSILHYRGRKDGYDIWYCPKCSIEIIQKVYERTFR